MSPSSGGARPASMPGAAIGGAGASPEPFSARVRSRAVTGRGLCQMVTVPFGVSKVTPDLAHGCLAFGASVP